MDPHPDFRSVRGIKKRLQLLRFAIRRLKKALREVFGVSSEVLSPE
jgi:hypothetical protein